MTKIDLKLTKKPGDVLTARELNDIMNMLIGQHNLTQDQIESLKALNDIPVSKEPPEDPDVKLWFKIL